MKLTQTTIPRGDFKGKDAARVEMDDGRVYFVPYANMEWDEAKVVIQKGSLLQMLERSHHND